MMEHDTAAVAEVGDVEMEEMDLDLTIDPDMAALDEEVPAVGAAQYPTIAGDGVASGELVQPTEEAKQPAPMKVYIHGLDEFTTEDVKGFSMQHFPAGDFEKVEWIDDSSAKVVYGSVGSVALALEALIDGEHPDPRPSPYGDTYLAKRSSARPSAELRVRRAALGDVKKARAHEVSRFYLMNPGLDRRERRRAYECRRGRNGQERGDYRRRRFDDGEQTRREEGGGFDVNMYDDDGGQGGRARPASDSEGLERRRRSRRRRRRRNSNSNSNGDNDNDSDSDSDSGSDSGSHDLFGARAGNRLASRLRDRSASPLDDGDGRHGFEQEQAVRRRTARQRSTTPPPQRRRERGREHGKANVGKELFPAGDGGANGAGKELFPMKSARELFPNRTSVSVHRRTAAFDAADETPQKSRGRLADRITGGRAGRADGRGEGGEGAGFGGAASQQSPGFSIRGAASDASTVVKELFPLKSGSNAGKELFGEKIKGRGGARRRAEDMF